MARENIGGEVLSSFSTPDLKSIEHFNEFEKIALKEVMATSRDILESLKFALIFASKVTPEMQKETIVALKDYRGKENFSGRNRAEAYEAYIKDY